jgi:glycosyltransferase involved in cell wall biosynthesis
VITEAMASGLPVVATDIAGIPEQVVDDESGYLIPTGGSEMLADRLDMLLKDGELRECMGTRGQERAERFSMDTMIDDLQDLYEGLLVEVDGKTERN